MQRKQEPTMQTISSSEHTLYIPGYNLLQQLMLDSMIVRATLLLSSLGNTPLKTEMSDDAWSVKLTWLFLSVFLLIF
jgi:hypothetical protein